LLWAALLTVYIGWGATYLGIRVMVETIPPLTGGGIRFLAAGLLLGGWLVARHGLGVLRVTASGLASAALVGALLLIGGNGLVMVAEQSVGAGLAALLVAAMPLWIVVLRLGLGERPARRALVGLVLGLVGVGILALPGSRPSDTETWAIVLLLVAPVLWAGGSVAAGRLPMPRDVFATATLELLVAGAGLLVLAVALGEQRLDPGAVSGRSLAGLLFLIGPGSILAFTAYAWLLQRAPLTLVSTYAFVNPVVAVALAALLLGEELTAPVLLGAAVIVAAVALVVTTPAPGRRPVGRVEVPVAAGREQPVTAAR
jgi:drug/metabolite transporter (DMT)-like permease